MWVIVKNSIANHWNEIITAFIPLVAAFGGAWFAFLLQNRKDKKRVTNENFLALNKVQINLTQQLNALTILNKDFIQPYKEHPIKWIAIPAIPHRDYSKLRIDAGSLAFLVEKDAAYLISEILVVEEKFEEAMNLINNRSNVHDEQLQPSLAEMGFVEGKPFHLPPEEVERLLGVQLVGTLKRLTDGLIILTEDAIQSHAKIIKDIKSIGTKIFPSKRVLSFEYVVKENL